MTNLKFAILVIFGLSGAFLYLHAAYPDLPAAYIRLLLLFLAFGLLFLFGFTYRYTTELEARISELEKRCDKYWIYIQEKMGK